MNNILSVDDLLAEQEVTIVITLETGEHTRDERPAQVSVGVTGQPPVTRIGTFSQMTSLINEAWTAFGVQTQVAAAQGARVTGQTTEPAGETPDTPALRADAASVVEVAVSSAEATTLQPHTPAPDPQPDLSFLF